MEKELIISDSAVAQIKVLLVEENNPELMLRVRVSSGGCSGFQYNFCFDNATTADDIIIEKDGIKVVIDESSLALLQGSQIDYVQDMMGASFQINNPNAASSCGCGNSFSI